MREKDAMRTTTRFNLVLNDLFNQPISGFILLLELHLKPVKNEAGTNRGQNESSGRGCEGRLSWAHLEAVLESNDVCQTPIFITASLQSLLTQGTVSQGTPLRFKSTVWDSLF
jgi:hypothetical protein